MFGASGDQDFFARENGWCQIGKGFAGTGAGFGNKNTTVDQHIFDMLSHFLLTGSRRESWQVVGEWAISAQYVTSDMHNE